MTINDVGNERTIHAVQCHACIQVSQSLARPSHGSKSCNVQASFQETSSDMVRDRLRSSARRLHYEQQQLVVSSLAPLRKMDVSK